MGLKWSNNSESTLASGINASVTTLEVQTGHGSRFPTCAAAAGDFFYATLVNVAGQREIIKVTRHDAGTDIFQVMERAADPVANAASATAYVFAADDVVQMRIPAVAVLTTDQTRSTTFHIDSDNTGPLLKNNSAVLEVRNATDAAYADVHCKALTLGGALALGTNAVSGVTTLAMAGALTGVTDLTASGALNAATIALSGAAVISGTSSIPINNEATSDKIVARDHGTIAEPEVVNVVYGTGSPPTANTTQIGTIFIKYIA